MKIIPNKKYKKIANFVIALLTLVGLTSCDFIYEDLPECAPPPQTYTVVDFVYDYNMKHTDLLKEHIGSVYLYVFDEKGIYQTRRELHKNDMRGQIDFSMKFDTTEIATGNIYQFVAVAQANHEGYEASLQTPGFTLVNEMIPGVSTIDDYQLKLDRNNDHEYDFGVIDYKDIYGNTETMIDTLWSTKPDQVQIVDIPKLDYTPSLYQQPDRVVNVEVPLMRITNSLIVRLSGSNFNENTSVDKYSMLVHFPHGNGTIDFTGNILEDEEFYYRTIRKTLEHITPETRSEDDYYAIKGVFGISRLVVDDKSSLQIRDGETGELLSEIPDFSQFLAKSFDHGFEDDQEFLDREYDFEVEINLTDDGQINYVDLSIAVLGWHKRIWFTDL